MLKNIKGIVISEVDFKESSKILSILTHDGLIGVVSKGCKKLKSPIRIISSKFSYANYTIYYNEDKLSILKEGSIINDFKHIRSDLILISYLNFLTDLINQVIKQDLKDSNIIYDLYINTLLKIEDGLNPIVMSNILEVKLLDYLGAPINFDKCIKCDKSNEIVTFDVYEGGYICKNCYTNQIIYDTKTLKMLKMYYMINIENIKELKISDNVINDINNILNAYYDRFTGIYIKSKDFLNRNK